MRKLSLLCSSIPVVAMAVFALGSAAATYADSYPLSKPPAVSETDLRVIAELQGILFQRFDLAINENFCVRISVAVTAEGEVDSESVWGHCSLAGSHRLMVVLRTTDDHSLVVSSALRDSGGMGGTAGTGPITVPSGGWSMGNTLDPNGEPPALSEGKRTLIGDFVYGRRPAHTVGIRVHAELLPNPAGTTGSGAILPPSIGKRE
jgi:hypothetical protein